MRHLFCLAVIAGLLIPGPVFADRSCKCKRGFVFVGDSMSTVLKKCGEPDERRLTGEDTKYSAHRLGSAVHGSSTSQPIEKWTYNKSSSRFPRIFTFRGSTLKWIEMDRK